MILRPYWLGLAAQQPGLATNGCILPLMQAAFSKTFSPMLQIAIPHGGAAVLVFRKKFRRE